MTIASVVSNVRSPRRQGVDLRAADRDDVGDIVASACARYPDLRADGEVSDCTEALAILDTIWQAAVQAVVAVSPPDPRDIELLSRVKSATTAIQSDRAEQVDSGLAGLHDAIADLDQIDDVTHLLDRAAIGAASLGFDRAMISSVSDGQWIPAAGHIGSDPTWAAEIVAAGRQHPEIIDAALPEAEMLRRLRPILVEDVGRLPRCYSAIIDAAKGQRYIAAPILAHRNVIGFVHVDSFYRRRRFTNSDIRLLGLFGEFLGATMSRLMMIEELRALHEQVDGISAQIADLQRRWSGQTYRRPTLTGTVGAASPAAGGDRVRAATALTRRELEVLELVAQGATNARIARALTISEGTVKGHLKHIFRKLGTANRAEAVSYWLRRVS